MSRPRSPFAGLLADLKAAFSAVGVDWYVFGAQAALLYGASRLTADVDVTVRLGSVTTRRLATVLEANGFRLRIDKPSFVRNTRVLPVLHVSTGIPADLVLAGPGLEDSFLERAEPRDLGGVRVPVARAEDVVVMKILAARDKDHEDVAAIVAARGATLDVKLIETTLESIEDALGQSDLLPAWRAIHGKRKSIRVTRRGASPTKRRPRRR